MYSFPIKYFERNLIFNDSNKECWAMFKMEGFNYDYHSNKKKIALLNRLARFIANIGEEAKILIIPVAQDIDSHYKSLVDRLDKKDALYKAAQAHAYGTSKYLKDKIKKKGNSNDYMVYVLTKLKSSESIIKDLKDAFLYLIKSPLRTIEEFFSVDTKTILEREFKTFLSLTNEYLKSQSKRIRLKEADVYDTQWLIRRSTRRGLGEVKVRKNLRKNGDGSLIEIPWTPFSERVIKNGEYAVRAYEKDVLSLPEGVIDLSEKRTLKVIHDDGISYQAFLAITHIPDGIEFPGNEWLLVLQDYPIQTEVCIHINTIEHKESMRKIGGKKREIKGQIEHIIESEDEVPDDLLEAKQSADEMEAELKATRDPISRVSITLCLAADNKEELEESVDFIKEFYEDHYFMVERPLADQLKLFMEFIPGTGRYLNDYVLPLPPRTLAGSMFGATRMLGDNVGPYIATTGVLEKNVYLDMSRACRLNRSASAVFLGNLGMGKSFNANLLMYLQVLYGGKALVFDPKGERKKWLWTLPEFEGMINVIELSPSIEDKGKLDPFIIYKDDMEEAGEIALNILAEIFKIDPKDDEYIAILEAINYTKKHERPCMSILADRLLNFPESDEFYSVAKKVGRRIKLLREVGMAGLLFGNGDEEGLSFDKRINVLQIQNLKLPDREANKEDYSQEEIISTVLMIPIASFAKKFVLSPKDKNIFKVILFDESWALSATKKGAELQNFFSRMGRSLYAGSILIGHSVNDLKGEGVQNAVSYKFCFMQDNTEEIKRVLKFLNLEVTEENIREVRSLKNRECLFQDLDGRVGKIKFDCVFEHLINAFNTTPVKEKVLKEGEAGDKTA